MIPTIDGPLHNSTDVAWVINGGRSIIQVNDPELEARKHRYVWQRFLLLTDGKPVLPAVKREAQDGFYQHVPPDY